MWLSRRLVALALPLLAAACVAGYAPVNAPDGAASALRNGEVLVEAPQTEDEFAFVQRLEQRLGTARRNPRFGLDYTISTGEDPVGVRPDQATQRYNVIGRIDWTVTDLASGGVVNSGGFETFTSYAATGSTVSGPSAQQDAHQRLMVLLADQLVTRLTATAEGWATPLR